MVKKIDSISLRFTCRDVGQVPACPAGFGVAAEAWDYRNAALAQVSEDDSGREHCGYYARQLLRGSYRNKPAPLECFSVFRDILPIITRPDRPILDW